MRTYLEKLKDIESMAKVDEWAEWKKQSYRSMRFGESFERDAECTVSSLINVVKSHLVCEHS